MVERMSAFQISISSRKLERTPRDPLGTGINEITVKFQNEAPGLIFFPLGTGINEITVKFQNEAPGLIFFRGPF